MEHLHNPIQGTAQYLPSDARNRTDALALLSKTVEEAQAEKERLENI